MDSRTGQFRVLLIAIAFLGYWTLLVYCDVWRPAPPGLSFQYAADGIHLADVVAGGPADRAGLRAGDRLLAVDNHPVSGRLDWMSVEANFEIGRPNRVTAERGGEIVSVELTPQLASWASWRAQHGPSLLLVRITQLATLSLGIFVALKRSRDPRALVGATFLATAGVFSLAVPHRFASVWRALPLLASLPLWVPFINNVAIAAWGYSFFAMLPRRRAFRWWLWLLIWLPVAPGLVGNAMFGYATIVLGRPAPFWPWTATLIASGIAYVGAAVVALLKNYRRLDDVNERRRVRILTLGSLVGVLAGAPVVVSYWRGTESNLDQAFIASPLVLIGTLLFLALPLSFAYAILRHRLFDVGIMIRQGLRYAMARRALLAIVPILLLLLGADVMAHSDQPVSVVLRSRLWAYLAIGVLALVARSRRQRWLDALDRRFFRERYNGQRLLRDVADDLRKSEGLEPAASVVAARVEQALHCRFVALALRDPRGSGYRAVAVSPPGHTPPSIAADNRVLTLTALLGQPVEVSESAAGWLARKLPSADIRAVQAADIELLVPVRSGQDSADAFLALGAKRSEEPYTDEDTELLMAIADNLAVRLAPAIAAARAGSPQVLAGRYQLEERLGEGGMGTVYAARDLSLDRRVAVKLVRQDLAGLPGAVERFQREARAAAAFSHPHVVTVHDFGVSAGHGFLVMELLVGPTLRDLLEREEPIAPARALPILKEVASAVDAAHARQIVHRDLKPDNICVVTQGTVEHAKVLDFGIATFVMAAEADSSPIQTTGGALLGTPAYMAPEQLRGEEPDPSWDLWALTVMAFEMLNGRRPFTTLSIQANIQSAAGIQARRAAIPAECEQIFASALAIDARLRPSSAGAA